MQIMTCDKKLKCRFLFIRQERKQDESERNWREREKIIFDGEEDDDLDLLRRRALEVGKWERLPYRDNFGIPDQKHWKLDALMEQARNNDEQSAIIAVISQHEKSVLISKIIYGRPLMHWSDGRFGVHLLLWSALIFDLRLHSNSW